MINHQHRNLFYYQQIDNWYDQQYIGIQKASFNDFSIPNYHKLFSIQVYYLEGTLGWFSLWFFSSTLLVCSSPSQVFQKCLWTLWRTQSLEIRKILDLLYANYVYGHFCYNKYKFHCYQNLVRRRFQQIYRIWNWRRRISWNGEAKW